MPKSDIAHEMTEKRLAELEKKIAAVYSQAADDMDKKIKAFFDSYAKKDAEKKKQLEAGKITDQEYKQWRLGQMARGTRYKAMRDALAERLTQANEIAATYINGATPGIYALNRNFSGYELETQNGAIGFTWYDEETVRRLIIEDPDLMPYYPEDLAINRGIDLAWGKKQITANITSGILRGSSIDELAKALMEKIPGMGQSSAVRAARTAATGAQNGGRLAGYAAASALGIDVRKRWVATKDAITRASHGVMDGEVKPWDKPFSNGLMYPGDPSGPGEEVYNCRCTMRTVEKEGIEAELRQMRVRDPVTGKNVLVNEMTYKEWERWKEAVERGRSRRH